MYSHGLEDLCVSKYQARPHWGKMNYFTAEQIKAQYERLQDFKALRQALDPTCLFCNEYLANRLGLWKYVWGEGRRRRRRGRVNQEKQFEEK